MRNLPVVRELSFEQYGGAECFFADIDGDGRPEIVTYQGPGCFGASMFRDLDRIKPLYPRSTSVSAFRFDGTRLWTWGEPNPLDRPYVSHAYECCIACADVDGDGVREVALADGDRVVVLDGQAGREKRSCRLPYDNFYIVGAIGEPTARDEAAIVVKNSETGYDDWRYGEPVIGLNSALEVAWQPSAIGGGGHYILALHLNGDGKKGYLIGYCAIAPDGKTLWSVDAIDPGRVEPGAQHVDYADFRADAEGKRLFAFAGSDMLYVVKEGGETLFATTGPHVQGAAIGRFLAGDDLQVACYSAPDGPLNLYDLSGERIWSRPTSRRWPFGEPAGLGGRRFHRNRPIVALPGAESDWIGYADGGWPWGMDGSGEISLEFEAPENSREVSPPVSPEYTRVRADDTGYGFALQIVDVEGDGCRKAVIYNRRFLWVYDLD